MRPIRFAPTASFLAASLLVCLLAACHADPNEEAVQCPKAGLLPDATRLTRYDGRGTDIADLVLGVRLTDVQGACSGKLGTRLEGAHAHVVMVATRGPAAQSPDADIAYKIGVVQAGQVISEKAFVQHVSFPPNVTTLQVTGQEIPMKLPLSKSVSGPDYHIYFWLQLSPAELDANRRHPAG